MKKTKIFEIFLGVIVSVLVLITLLIMGIGSYFVNYAIARKGNGGNREVIPENEIVQNEDFSKAIIENNKKIATESATKWEENTTSEKVEIITKDRITLRGTEYFQNTKTNKWAIVLHGYRSSTASVLTIGEHFYEKGYNVLIPSMRGCGESEGNYIGMGWLDKEDVKGWINLICESNQNAEIVLHGSSMGAATVLMASGEALPDNVKYIIEDSGYTSVWDIFASEAKARFNLPAFPLLNMFQIVAKVQAGYDIKEASSIEQVKKSKVPILFIHGNKDDFVPKNMCDILYDAATCDKEKLIIEDAGHTESKYKDPDTYYNKIFEFIKDI